MRWRWGKLTGKLVLLNSSKSLTLPTTMIPVASRTFILRAMIPPQTAFVWPGGCFSTAKVPGWIKSAQWESLGIFFAGRPSSDDRSFGANKTVNTGAMVTCGSVAWYPCCGLYATRSAMKPAPGTLSFSKASEISHAEYCASCAMMSPDNGDD